MKCRSRRSAKPLDATPICLEEDQDIARCIGRLNRSLGDTFQEESEPDLPITLLAHLLQQVVVVASMRLEKEAEVECGQLENALRAQEQRDQEAVITAVAVEERVNQIGHQVWYAIRRRWHEECVAGIALHDVASGTALLPPGTMK